MTPDPDMLARVLSLIAREAVTLVNSIVTKKVEAFPSAARLDNGTSP